MLICRRCNSNKTTEIEGTFGPHKIKVVCASCQRFVKWGTHRTPEEKHENNEKHREDYYNKKGWNFTPRAYLNG
jgi:hypothetical protein